MDELIGPKAPISFCRKPAPSLLQCLIVLAEILLYIPWKFTNREGVELNWRSHRINKNISVKMTSKLF
jgi:hypothetical protein